METRPPTTLKPRGTLDRRTALAHVTPRHKVGMAQMILVAAVLVIAIDLATPRPNVILESVAFDAPGCVGNATSQNVTATFLIVNRGTADTVVVVTLSVDGQPWVSSNYGAPALGSMPGVLQGALRDCSSHRFSLNVQYSHVGGA